MTVTSLANADYHSFASYPLFFFFAHRNYLICMHPPSRLTTYPAYALRNGNLSLASSSRRGPYTFPPTHNATEEKPLPYIDS